MPLETRKAIKIINTVSLLKKSHPTCKICPPVLPERYSLPNEGIIQEVQWVCNKLYYDIFPGYMSPARANFAIFKAINLSVVECPEYPITPQCDGSTFSGLCMILADIRL